MTCLNSPDKPKEQISVSDLAILVGCTEEWLDYLRERGKITRDNALIFDTVIDRNKAIIKRMTNVIEQT